MIDIHPYVNRRTLILGDVNSGKTARTRKILSSFSAAGHTKDMAVLDLAPDSIEGVGGKMNVSADIGLLYLTAPITAPRLMGKDESHIQLLARENARLIEGLFNQLQKNRKKILFVNDVTLYLHAGDFAELIGLLETADTCVINAYHGKTFKPSAVTFRERQLIKKLIDACDRRVYL